jgi:hypothetical protein
VFLVVLINAFQPGGRGSANTIVTHRNKHYIIRFQLKKYTERSFGLHRHQAMPDGVFDKRLQYHRWNHYLHWFYIFGHIYFPGKVSTETILL